ncbi:hypothetical protein Glove_781g3 [Diversispora epigaea]|uniref:Uncharacterized protein n=1 Tax=Diversispora epigaea TaxID=1348612 RepID=A0A397G7C0_9GLOM|nr:hypothetical protein Glove_781g3 [Diversispora epigaea]
MVQIVASLRESFEECAIQLHHYNYPSQDEIDKRIFCLFANRDESNDLVDPNKLGKFKDS